MKTNVCHVVVDLRSSTTTPNTFLQEETRFGILLLSTTLRCHFLGGRDGFSLACRFVVVDD